MTAIGLIFAVLTERIRWAVAFKIAVFMPMAISLFAAGVIWRDHGPAGARRAARSTPSIGVGPRHVRAAGRAVRRAALAHAADRARPQTGFVLKTPVRPGGDRAAAR